MRRLPPGWSWGPCWAAWCIGRVAWPPNTVGADIECDSINPHRGHVHPTQHPRQEQ